MLTHVVLFRFAEPSDAAEGKRRLQTLPGLVPSLRSLYAGVDAGVNVSVGADGLATPPDWHLALVTTHDDAAGLAAYQEHPAHQEVAGWLRERTTERAVVDAHDGE